MNSLINIGAPVVGIMIVAFYLPYFWALFVREGVQGLAVNFVLSAFVISLVVFAYFFTFYAGQHGPLVADLLERPRAFWPYYLTWVGKTSLVWLPLLVLGVAAQPKRWKEVVW